MSSRTHNVLLFFLKFINYPEEKHYRQTLDMNCDQLIHLIIVVYHYLIKAEIIKESNSFLNI
jgi:hypothetical protein